jgi:Fur family ferric uptake transcriptional regulator
VTNAPRSDRLAFRDIGDVAAALRERGGRLTAARRHVLEALFAADGPVSAEYIAAGAGGHELDPASVYRNLEHLEDLGVVRHVHLGHGPGLYALISDGEREYLVCESCDRVTIVDAARLDAIRAGIRDEFGYHARFSHFPIHGLCEQCAAEQPPPTAHEHRHGHGSYVHAHGEHAHRH